MAPDMPEGRHLSIIQRRREIGIAQIMDGYLESMTACAKRSEFQLAKTDAAFLTNRHLLGHLKNQLAILFVGLAQGSAELT
jgi:hypothetical protein